MFCYHKTVWTVNTYTASPTRRKLKDHECVMTKKTCSLNNFCCRNRSFVSWLCRCCYISCNLKKRHVAEEDIITRGPVFVLFMPRTPWHWVPLCNYTNFILLFNLFSAGCFADKIQSVNESSTQSARLRESPLRGEKYANESLKREMHNPTIDKEVSHEDHFLKAEVHINSKN